MANVAGQTITLTLPPSKWRRQAILVALGETTESQTRLQVAAAALFLCWPRAASKVGAPRYNHNVQAYGAAVIDYLLDNGATMEELWAAGAEAVEFVTGGVPSDADHEEARGNFEAPLEG